MASNATIPTHGRMAQVIHWLFPSRQQLAISLGGETILELVGMPLCMHLALALMLHLAISMVRRMT